AERERDGGSGGERGREGAECRADRLVVDEFGGALCLQREDRAVGRRTQLGGGLGHGCKCRGAGAVWGAGKERVGSDAGSATVTDTQRDELVWDDGAGAHGEVESATGTDWGHGRGTDDVKARGCRDGGVMHIDRVADMFVQYRECGCAEDDL